MTRLPRSMQPHTGHVDPTTRRMAVWLCVAFACASPQTEDSAASTGGLPTTTTDPATTSGETTAAPASTSGDTSGGASSSSDDGMPSAEGPTPLQPKSCDLAVMDPAADPTQVIAAGDGDAQIPTVIGDVLLRNCGCHYNVNELPIADYVDYVSDAQPMATWADFHADFTGTFPIGYETMPAYLAVEQRVVFEQPLPMPTFQCGVEDEDGMITVADLAMLTEWFAAGAPDGATWLGR